MTVGKPLRSTTRPMPSREAEECNGREPKGWPRCAHQVCQLVKHFVDLLAVHKPNMGLSHQAPHLLPDIILIHLESQNRILITFLLREAEFFFGCTPGMQKFLGQGLNPSHSSDNTRSLTHCTTREP